MSSFPFSMLVECEQEEDLDKDNKKEWEAKLWKTDIVAFNCCDKSKKNINFKV
jgi:hypothetical protein